MVRIALLLAFTASACTTDGHYLTGRWNPTSCSDGLYATGVTIEVAGSTTIVDHAACGDGGFATIVPDSITKATVSISDGTGAKDVETVSLTDDVDLGEIVFDPGTWQD